MTLHELRILVAQHDPGVARRIEGELKGTGLRVAGPVTDLGHATARAEGEMVAAVLLDVALAGGGGLAAFRARHPDLPVVATAPRRLEAEAKAAVAGGARIYLLDEELGRGLLVPVLRHLARSAEPPSAARRGGAEPATTASRHLLHDLGNLLAVASGESELLVERVPQDHALAGELRDLNSALAESVRLFRRLAASWRTETGSA